MLESNVVVVIVIVIVVVWRLGVAVALSHRSTSCNGGFFTEKGKVYGKTAVAQLAVLFKMCNKF